MSTITEGKKKKGAQNNPPPTRRPAPPVGQDGLGRDLEESFIHSNPRPSSKAPLGYQPTSAPTNPAPPRGGSGAVRDPEKSSSTSREAVIDEVAIWLGTSYSLDAERAVRGHFGRPQRGCLVR